MPRLWSSTIESHRREVRDAAIDVTAGLIADRGLRSVTMSEIAERTGVGRATLYKYFPDVESILRAWHEREIATHLEKLSAARDAAGGPADKLHAVVKAFALISQHAHRGHDAELAAQLHRQAESVTSAEAELGGLMTDVIHDAASVGVVRSDVPAHELASYCRHALAAAGQATSKQELNRLVEVTLAGLRPS